MSTNPDWCYVCLDLKWDLYPANKNFDYRARRIRSTSLHDSSAKGYRPCHILLEGIKAVLQGFRPPATVELDIDRPYWLYVKIKPQNPLHLIAYVYFLVRSDTEVLATNKTFKFELEFFTAKSIPSCASLLGHVLTEHNIDKSVIWPAFGAGRTVPSSLSARYRQRVIKGWLKDCDEKHHSCVTHTKTQLPRRVLDIEGLTSRLIRLFEPRGETGRYATLSHCWGEQSMITTT